MKLPPEDEQLLQSFKDHPCLRDACNKMALVHAREGISSPECEKENLVEFVTNLIFKKNEERDKVIEDYKQDLYEQMEGKRFKFAKNADLETRGAYYQKGYNAGISTAQSLITPDNIK